jgi:hypothetical protein
LPEELLECECECEWECALRKGKEEDSVDTGGTGKEGTKDAALLRADESGSGRLLVRLLFGEPIKGFCLMFLSTLR